MVSQVKKFMNDENKIFTEQARMLRKAPGNAVRGAAARSAKRIKALQEPVRVITHSGVKLTNVSHEALLSLMALQLEVVTAALSDAAAQLERVAQSDNVKDLVSGQAGELRATRERVVDEMKRAVAIVKHAGRGVRNVATETYTKVTRPAKAAKAKTTRTVKRAVRKTKAKAKKTVRRAK
jgi:phasin family protein